MLFRCLSSAFIVGQCFASGSENDALMQSQSRNEDALEFVNNKERVQLSELHKNLLKNHNNRKDAVEEHHRYHAHLTQHHESTHEVMVSYSAHADRLKRSARELEQEYRNILEMMISAPTYGKEYTPPESMFTGEGGVVAIFTTIKTELGVEQTGHQKLIDDANTNVKKCNDTLTTEFVTTEDRLGKSNLAYDAHEECRGDENKMICTTKTSCDKFNAMDKCGAKSPLKQHDQDWYAKMIDSTARPNSVHDSLNTVINAAKTCRNQLNAEHKKAKECDDKQRDYERKFCSFGSYLSDSNDKYNQCDAKARKLRADKEVEVKEMEKDNKVILMLVKKVDCYLDVLQNVTYTQKIPVQAQFEVCRDLEPTTGELDVDYKEPIAKTDMTAWLFMIKTFPSNPDNGFDALKYGSSDALEGSVHDYKSDCKKGLDSVPTWQKALNPTKLQAQTVCQELSATTK